MKTFFMTTFVTLLLLTMGVGFVFAGSQSEPVSVASLVAGADVPAASGLLQKDSELAGKFAEFKKFTVDKVKQLNKNLKFARSRMEIVRLPDGLYRARYHQIDDSTLGVKVNRSQSRSIPFVGVLSYTEQVYEAFSKSPDAFPSEGFVLVQIIPNRHIFSYKQGKWD